MANNQKRASHLLLVSESFFKEEKNMNLNCSFKPMTEADIPLWEQWIQKPHVKDVWFIEGYELPEYIHQKIKGNGYDYPFIIYVNDTPIGYIQCSDLYAYRTTCPKPRGVFTNEKPGTWCMDLFIGEEEFLGKGYGTQIVKAFSEFIFENFAIDTILIDPAATNKRAIRCYEKAEFTFVKTTHDGVTECHVMKKERPSKN